MSDEPIKNPSSKRPSKKWPIVVGVVVAVLVVAGADMWVWHGQPSFCGAICHTPMAEYLETYESTPGQPSVDKADNEVTNSSAMLAVSHKDVDGDTCLDCHVPTMDEQISEGMNWLTGNYYAPLEERSLTELGEARGNTGEQFCLNDACHTEFREDLEQLTSDMGSINPHKAQHGEMDCGYCHKAHRASVMQCAGRHEGAQVPDGWVTPQQAEDMSYDSDRKANVVIGSRGTASSPFSEGRPR